MARKRKRSLKDKIALYLWYHRPYVSNAKPIIVGGCNRSGTTITRVILDTHSQICCGPETQIFTRGTLPHGDPEFLEKKLAYRFDFSTATVQQMLAASKSHSEFVDRFFAAYCQATGKSCWAEKTPHNVFKIGYIFKHFPNARFIHVIRDGRATICSLLTHPRHKFIDGKWVKNTVRNPINECVAQWVNAIGAGRAFRADPRYIEVRYEELIFQPEKTLKNLFSSCGYAWEDRVLEFHKVKNNSREATKMNYTPEANMPLFTSSAERWQTDLSQEEIAYIKQHAGPLLIELGYVADNSW